MPASLPIDLRPANAAGETPAVRCISHARVNNEGHMISCACPFLLVPWAEDSYYYPILGEGLNA